MDVVEVWSLSVAFIGLSILLLLLRKVDEPQTLRFTIERLLLAGRDDDVIFLRPDTTTEDILVFVILHLHDTSGKGCGREMKDSATLLIVIANVAMMY